MDTWQIILLLVAVAIVVGILTWLVMRMRQRRAVNRLKATSDERRELAADRHTEADARLDDAAAERERAEQAAEEASKLQAEADARASAALEAEAEAEAIRSEAGEHTHAAHDAERQADELR